MEGDNIQAIYSERRSEGADEVRRFNRFQSFHNLVVVLLMFVEPISNILASFTDQGRHLVGSSVQWIQTYLGRFGQHGRQAHSCKKRVRSRDLKSVRFLGQGFSGFVYETTWSTWYGKEKSGHFARKDFPGVESKVFENEAARLVNLDHPNVVKAFCWTVDRLSCSLVLEFVSNDLQSVVEKRKEARRKDGLRHGKSVHGTTSPFETIMAMYIMLDIAKAMEYLHSEGVVHGDLRPNNVLVEDSMVAKVVDFGLIESKKRTTLVSKRARFLQTLEWGAPETFKKFPASFHDCSSEHPWEEMDAAQAEGSFGATDELADVYSFAITCAYVMGGKVSYPKSLSSTELLQNISFGALRPEIPFICPMPLRELIQSSWDSDPERIPRFFQLRKELEELISTSSLGSDPENRLRFLQHRKDLENLQQEETAEAGKGNFPDDKLMQYLLLTDACMERMQRMASPGVSTSPRLNSKQCKYLVHKLKVAMVGAHLFSTLLEEGYFCLTALQTEANYVEIYKLLYALAREVEDFIQHCCKDEWIQAALTLTNVSELLAFNLELCALVLSRTISKNSGRWSCSRTEAAGVSKAEAEIVKERASVDRETLLTNVNAVLQTREPTNSEYHLASLLLAMLERPRPILVGDTPGSSQSNIFETFVRSLTPMESLGKGASATVYRATWLGVDVAKKTFYGPICPDFEREVSVLEGLSHPNITSLLCHDKDMGELGEWRVFYSHGIDGRRPF